MFTENYKGKIHLKTLCALLTLTRIGGGFHNRKERNCICHSALLGGYSQ